MAAAERGASHSMRIVTMPLLSVYCERSHPQPVIFCTILLAYLSINDGTNEETFAALSQLLLNFEIRCVGQNTERYERPTDWQK